MATKTLGEWECGRCGWITDGESAPPLCAECGAPSGRFIFYMYLDDSDWNDEVEPRDVEIPNEEYGDT
ncbi:MAG: hypothetical protein HZB53_01375 [Chloroflexi bacterium]|nr:hypothetical protein [Chloroflexota bacterium]